MLLTFYHDFFIILFIDDSTIDELNSQSAEEGGYNSAPKQSRNPPGIRINTKKAKKVNTSMIGAPEAKPKNSNQIKS
jgi:hypothetical protein